SDGLLNTNADTIAATLAEHFVSSFQVHLLLCFGKTGVLRDASDEASVIDELSIKMYEHLRTENAVAAGMLPKLDNGFRALENGVAEVRILSWRDLASAVEGKPVGTLLVNGEW
ncbi:MAG: acetylglutamate kinase, partial [Calditrichota bacterium]